MNFKHDSNNFFFYARYYKYKLCLRWDNQPASHYNNVVLNLGASENQQQRVESDRPHAVENEKKKKQKQKRYICIQRLYGEGKKISKHK